MDALNGLITNVPDWIKRLDDLSSQIDQRQLELARFVDPSPVSESPTTPDGAPSRAKSVRNKGSTESLKPQDEGAAFNDELDAIGAVGKEAQQMSVGRQGQGQGQLAASPTSPGAGERARLALLKQTTQVAEVAQAQARATLRKRTKRSDSVASADGPAPKYRTRSMIIVYYDSYVQSFFEELVRFVSAQRNLMRKAKMAAKVAYIKRMAELEMPDSIEPEDGPPVLDTTSSDKMAVDNTDAPKLEVDTGAVPAIKTTHDSTLAVAGLSGADDLPQLNYRRTLSMRSPGMLATGRPLYLRASGRARHLPSFGGMGGAKGSSLTGGQQPPDVYDELDRGLEYAQSMCEHAAHQFLRDGDCNEEIGNIKRRLIETKDIADLEMERVKKEEPEALTALDEPLKSRSFRPQTMRRDGPSMAASAKEALLGTSGPATIPRTAPGAIASAIEADTALEVDEGIDDMDAKVTPPLMYKSSRMR
ncbi:uncharacterized protein SPSK_00525 [Sporothrix schenckii 1099-18]|uniref:Uncharacterized protein n=2 Tax=Sporothrix schenckii TaxID=29908 RepID=U7Q779_SPOS1|nr:uncharacterized protein SPSK_00525 [Sporothrix schenckii 1099-18]ERT02581.1 hypothetical protein HMPREF1624_00881 [Sporothrix schenckii ATCC 58251]KJR80127.1 hypothetical protein SPSK_00525 [Sporothrix schenckii 1099-18]